MTQLPYLDSPVPLAFAHRGFSRTGLENSLPAFAAAAQLGFTHVETDVHTTSDGVVVIFHDSTLDRVSTGAGRINELPAAVVGRALIGGTEPIPTLAALVEAFPDLRFNLDVKDEASVAPLAALIEEHGLHDRVCVASFSDKRRRAVLKRLTRRTASSAGVRTIALFTFLGWLPDPLLRRLLRGTDVLQIPVRMYGLALVTARSVARAHRLGLTMHVWTIDDPAQMHELFDLGVDGIMTDRADLLADVMQLRGYWP
ncbi:glycerophosphodiester phosphodiesterase [Arthrobacter sp. 35W]|uniref:glycerophosphodiester phosphodiesterase n=1 Tax=Arthrobacter sp. 35W TaxID=1132441 RepID=UPI00042396C8|nr:glycerophosphodiester phosphodiesterase [Arthrobacter sp. 35W]